MTEILIELQAPLDRNEVIDRYSHVRCDYEFFRGACVPDANPVAVKNVGRELDDLAANPDGLPAEVVCGVENLGEV